MSDRPKSSGSGNNQRVQNHIKSMVELPYKDYVYRRHAIKKEKEKEQGKNEDEIHQTTRLNPLTGIFQTMCTGDEIIMIGNCSAISHH